MQPANLPNRSKVSLVLCFQPWLCEASNIRAPFVERYALSGCNSLQLRPSRKGYDYGMIPDGPNEESPQEKYIRCEMELGLSLVQFARAARSNSNAEAATEAIERARVILSNIRHYLALPKTERVEIEAELEEQLAYLQFAVDSFTNVG